LIRVFSLLLRLAESLDRSHLGNVGQARFRLGPDGSCILEMYGPQNHQLELWGVLSHRRAFRKVFKRDLEVSSVIVDKEDEPIDEKQQEA
jgi:exopolyphosphatase/guanosine-5'-triphosphate,3'-diphosphate pyrophosphatase